MGEIYHVDEDKYYSNRIRKGYYVDKAGDHLDVGHVIGYKWAVQNLCPEEGYVFDPTAGTGTAVVESIINGKNGIGIELEYPEIGERNIAEQFAKARVLNNNVMSRFRQGDATKLDEYFEEWGFKEPFLDLIINGTPYPKLSGKSSDAPERKNLKTGQDKSFDYLHEDNIGLTKGDAYSNLVKTMYTKAIKYLKPGGYFVIIIKDLVQNKEPYLLHKEIIDMVLENNPDVEPYGFFLHKHVPTTMFINTYGKRFPGIPIPLYQTGIVLRKKGAFLEAGFPRELTRNIRIIQPHPAAAKNNIISPPEDLKEGSIVETMDKEFVRGYKKGYDAALGILDATTTEMIDNGFVILRGYNPKTKKMLDITISPSLDVEEKYMEIKPINLK
jgi:DNA modification methylase